MKPVIKKIFLYGTSTFVVLGLLGALTLYGFYLYLSPKLPDIDTLKDVRLQVPLRVYTQDNELINEFGQMKRSPMEYDEFPQKMVDAILAAEDDRFFEHPGVDYQGILRAAFELIKSGGDKRSGGSTITMQVARNFFLSREKTYVRKLNEIFLALKIEEELSKEEILALYLNKIFLGNRAYGFAAAAQVYYGKSLHELSLAQTAMLAGLPKAPSRYNPVANQERALERRHYVLKRMRELEYISEEEFMLASDESDQAELHGQNIELDAMYVAEMVRSEMLERYGNEALSAGFEVYTTIKKDKQDAANHALRTAMLEYDRRHGYRGHIQHVDLNKLEEQSDPYTEWDEVLADIDVVGNLEPAVVFNIDTDVDKENDIQSAAYAYTKNGHIAYLPWDKVSWARNYIDENHLGPELKSITDILKIGDVIYVTPAEQGCSWLAQEPRVSGALISLNPDNGSIEALVGGFDFHRSKFNRVTQAKRQPGSSFKPFIYSAAIDKGFTTASIINDAPVVFDAPGLEDTWRPENYTGRIYGETRLRKALIKSRNLVSIRLLRDIGIGYAVRYARRFGFENANLPRDLSLALGSGTLTPLELATGYSVFANGGYRINPYVIDHIIGPDGTVVHLTARPEVCVECLKQLEEEQKTADSENEAATTQDSEETTVSEEIPSEEPIVVPVQQDTLQAFLVAGDEQPSLEDNIKRELQFLEGPLNIIPAPRILSPQTSFLMNSMLRDVIKRGTGVRARVLGRNDLGGKTGTTNDQRDAWFSGFNASLVTIAWLGFDNPIPLGSRETGAKAALPMWIYYMREALKGMPETPLVAPPGIVSVRINAKTGQLTTATDPEAVFEYLLEDQIASDEIPIGKENGNQTTDITRDIF
ncbi:MAG: penicillin-binding protein 1A [Thioalkalispiraceae bacterium]